MKKTVKSLCSLMRRIAAPPVFPGDEDKTRTAFILNFLILLALVPAFSLETFLGQGPTARHLIVGISYLAIAIAGKTLMHAGHVRAACYVTLGFFWLSLALQNLVAGGIRAPGFVNHGIIILMAGLTLGYRGTIIFGCIGILTGIGLVHIERAGLLPAPLVVNTAYRHLGVYIWTFTMAASILWLALRCLRQALDRAQNELNERNQIAGALLESEERFRCTFEQAPVGIAHISPEGRFLRVNRCFCDLFGYQPEELLRLTFREISHPEDLPEGFDSVRKLLEEPSGGHSSEKRYCRKDGTVVWVNLTVSLIRETSSARGYYVAIVEDITGRKDAEASIFAYQDQLRSMAMELSRVEDEKRRQITVELHDRIGQNLALAQMKLTSLGNFLPPKEVKTIIDEACATLREVSGEVKSLIFEICPPELHELGLEAAIEELAFQFETRYGIRTMVTDGDPGVKLGHESRTALYGIVRELMVNVVKHAEATRMEISIFQEDGLLRVEVVDDGVGFDAGAAWRHGGKKKSFGLFSIRERVEYLGGCIKVESRAGQGTQVKVFVPVR
ncbi:MAG: PAS domain S-box protein [Syntrophobacteraceae bacterium]|nr:PAS domain S-box protein [Desulfobacteraceae bacterium]